MLVPKLGKNVAERIRMEEKDKKTKRQQNRQDQREERKQVSASSVADQVQFDSNVITRSTYIGISFNLHINFPHPIVAFPFPTHARHSFSCLYALTFSTPIFPQALAVMEAKKPKYSLFPAPPLSKPVSSPATPTVAQEESSPLDAEDPTTSREPSPPPPTQSLPSESHDQPGSSEPRHPDLQVAPPSRQQPPPEPDSPIFLSGMTPPSFSTASESSLKPAPLSLPATRQQPCKGPRRAFIRHGLGGAGNYHKRPDSSSNSDYSGFLSTLLGTFSHKKRKTRQYSEADSIGYSQYSNQALPLGAAEVLKRKMLGQASGGKRSTSSDRS